jgi:hypothetical protein
MMTMTSAASGGQEAAVLLLGHDGVLDSLAIALADYLGNLGEGLDALGGID